MGSMRAGSAPHSTSGSLVGGRYRLEERLGEGAAGVVYRAVHVGLEKSFAVKLLKTAGPPASAALERFRREAVALGRLRHPHIVEVTDSGVDDIPYLVMELLEGASLLDVCRERGPLPLAEAIPLLDQIADAVDAAHGAGVLHRDLKPGNVLVRASGEVKVVDFGLAELMAGPRGVPEDALGSLGTPLYAAPELIRHGMASPASDVYSFGVLAYELLGGRPPFRGTVARVLAGHLEEEPPALPSLPPEVWAALQGALAKDPALRPRSAGELVRRLREGAALAERARWQAIEAPRRRWTAAILTTALAVAGLLLPWPPLPAVEQRIDDLRARTSPARAPDPRILLITLDEASLDSSPLSLADRADEIARTLSAVLDAGARSVAVDILLPAKWSASPGFSDLVLRHGDHLTLAAFSSPGGGVVGTECLDPLTVAALGPHAADLFGFVNLDEDRDGVIRRGRLRFRDRTGNQRPSWAGRVAGWDGKPPAFRIDTRIDWMRYSRISWRKVPAALRDDPEMFRGRIVLVGGDFRGSGDDYHRIPGAPVSGLTLQALMVDTILAGLPLREAERLPVLAVSLLAAGLAVLRGRRLVPAAAAYLALSFPIFWWAGLSLPVAAPLLGLAAALALRRTLPSPPEVPAP